MVNKLRMLALAGLCLTGSAAATSREPAEYKTVRLSAREVLVACKEDASPKVDNRGGFVIVSCPRP